MKKRFFSLLSLSFLTLSLFAQGLQPLPKAKSTKQFIQKGQHYLSVSDLSLGVQVGRWYSPSGRFIPYGGTKPQYNQLNVRAKIGYGYMFTDRLMLGARLGMMGSYRWESGGKSFPITTQLDANAFARYYFTRGKFSTFVEAGLGITSGPANGVSVLEFADYTNFYQEVKLGMQYHVNERFSLEVSSGIRHNRLFSPFDLPSTAPQSAFQMFNPSIGFNFRL